VLFESPPLDLFIADLRSVIPRGGNAPAQTLAA